MSIEKSPIVRQQEEKIAELEAQIKKKNTTIKSLKTRLDNMRERIDELQRKARNSFASAKEKMQARTEKIIAILARLQKDKRFSKADRAQFKEMHQDIHGMVEETQPFNDPEFDFGPGFEEDRAKNFDPFAEFQVAPEPEVQQDLRKLYLKLSKRFHPDRAQGAKEQQLFHDIQQEIVRLYQAHDLQGLMNMAMQYDLNLLDFSESETDVLEQKIQFLTQQLSGLEQQQERLSEEIKNLRNSPLGQMLTDVDSFARDGVDITDAATMTGGSIDEMETYLEALEEVERTASMEPLIYHQNSMTDIDDLMAELLFGDDDNDDDYYDDDYDIDDFSPLEEATDPDFPVGSWVKFEAFADNPNKPLTVTGEVTAALYHPEGVEIYDIAADTNTLQKLPPNFIKKMLELDSLGRFKSVPGIMISSTKKPSKEKIAARYEALYGIYRQYAFNDLTAKQRKRIFNILDADPKKQDPENWWDHLQTELSFPFVAEVFEEDEILTAEVDEEEWGDDFSGEISVEVVGFTDSASPTSPNVLTIDKYRKERIFSLLDLECANKKTNELLLDYHHWADVYYPTFAE
ncbi:calcium-binding protein [Lewinella sp. LCG006]|uniref:calcium-binding protein n=1 Tax=Lewinella sp. LCG006 TaxID=3231911 RepID=UPI003460D6CF